MTRFSSAVFAFAVLVCACIHARIAHAVPTPAPEDAAGWVWTPLRVHQGVDPNTLVAMPPHVPKGTSSAFSPVSVATGFGALVWVDSMSTIRVRATDKKKDTRLRFRRLEKGDTGFALIDVPGVLADNGNWFLTEESAAGHAWLIEAEAPTEVSIEQSRPREGRLIWEHAQDTLLAWVEGHGPFPNLPAVHGRAALRTRLLAQQQVAQAIAAAGSRYAPIDRALLAWRKASALQELARIRPLVRPHYVSRRVRRENKIPVELPHLQALVEAGETAAVPYFRFEDGESWDITVRGPSVLRLTARALFLDPSQTESVLHVWVVADGREIDRLDVRLRPSGVRDPASATDPIPRYTDAITEHGDRVSRPVELSVPLLVGKHDYQIHIAGGPALAKVRIAARNYRAVSLAQGHSPRMQMDTGLRQLGDTTDPRARIVGWLLRRLQDAQPDPVDLAPLGAHPMVVQWFRASMPGTSTASLPTAGDPSPLELDTRRHLFQRFHRLGRPDLAASVLADRIRWLDADAFLALVLTMPADGTIDRVARGLEMVTHDVPLNDSLRRAHLELWRHTAWDRLNPAGDDIESWTWITVDDEPTHADDLAQDDPGRLWPLVPGRSHRIDLTAEKPAADARAVLSALVLPAPVSTGPVALVVDGHRWNTLPVGPTVQFNVLARAGPHDVQVLAPPGARVFVSAPPTDEGSPTALSLPAARRHRLWPLAADGTALRFELVPPPRGALLRLDVRALAAAPESTSSTDSDAPIVSAAPAHLRVRTSAGDARTVTLQPGPADPRAVPETAPASATDRISLTFAVDAKTRWIEIEGDPRTTTVQLAAALYVRRWEAAPPRETRVNEHAGETDVLAQLARLGRAIVLDPHHPDSYLQRGRLLLTVDAITQAQEDHDRVLELLNRAWDPKTAARLKVLARDIDDARGRDRLTVVDPTLAAAPILLAPALAELADDGADLVPWQAVAAALRRNETAPVPTGDVTPMATAFSALSAERAGDSTRAAFLWASLYAEMQGVATGLAASEQFRRALDEGADTDPAFAYGFVHHLQARIDSPRLRRLAALAGQRSRWVGLRYVEASAGMERLGTPVEPPGASDAGDDDSKWLLVLSPPWAASEDTLLRPGTAMVVMLPGGSAEFDVYCQAVRGPGANSPASGRTGLDVVVDGELFAHHEVASGDAFSQRIATANDTSRVAFRLDGADPRFLCSVRRPPTASSVPVLQSRQWLLARPDRPVRTTVLGPTVLQIEARHGAPHLGRAIDTFVTVSHGASVRTQSLQLPSDRDANVQVTAGTQRPLGTRVVHEVLLPERGPVTIVLEPGFAQMLTRLAVRESLPAPDVPPADDPYPRLRARVASLGTPYWPGAPPRVSSQDIGEPSGLVTHRLGSLEVELRLGRDDISEFDEFRPRFRVRNTVTWRRELVPDHLWIRAETAGQWRDLSGLAGGAEARIYGQLGPRRLRGVAAASTWGEEVAGRGEWSARGLLRLDWPVQVAPRVTVVPEVVATYRHQSLTIEAAGAVREGIHPQVYSRYVANHPLAVTPRVSARIRPLQDQVLVLGLSTTPNSDFRSNERTEADVDLRGIFDSRHSIMIGYRAGYQASLRFADEDRSDFYVRNRIRGGIDFVYLFVGAGRLTVSVVDSVYLSRPFPAQNVVELVLSFDLTAGRGIRDSSPMELSFRNLYELRWWKQGEEDDLL